MHVTYNSGGIVRDCWLGHTQAVCYCTCNVGSKVIMFAASAIFVLKTAGK